MLTFFVPSVRPVPTGGNIFNQEVITYLSRKVPGDIDVRVIDRGDRDRIPVETLSGQDPVAVVDSLVARYLGSSRMLRARKAFSKMGMVVHYLRLLNPASGGSKQIQTEREILQAFDGFITTSRFSRSVLISHGVNPGDVTVIRPGLHHRFRSPPKAHSKSPSLRLLTVSNFLPGKGLIRLMGVLEEMGDLPWRWDVAGSEILDGEYSKRFRNRVDESSVSSRVHLLGSLSPVQLVEVYDGSDIFVLPSEFESCSMVLMEAMARGLPAVAFDEGGIPETVMGSEGVWLIPPGDWASFGQAIGELVKNRSRRAAMGKQAWETSKRFSSWETTGREFHSWVLRAGAYEAVGG
ncbi:MAG: glycosyltransferase family 4 protein [Fidelibacterota bacterium]